MGQPPAAEGRWPIAATLAVAIAVPLLLPARFSLGPSWAVPAIEALLLVILIAADLSRSSRGPAVFRAVSLAIIAVLVIDAAGVTARLIGDLIEGGPETNAPQDLLSVGFLVWLYTIIAFGFLYWGLDGGGTQARARAAPEFPDLAFPSSSTRPSPRPAGDLNCSTTSTSALPTQPR